MYVKQHKSKRDRRGVVYAVHSRLLGLNKVNKTVSDSALVLQKSTYDREMKAWNWEKYVA